MSFKHALAVFLVACVALIAYVTVWVVRSGTDVAQRSASPADKRPSTPPVRTVSDQPASAERCSHCHPGGGPADASHRQLACAACHLGEQNSFEQATAHQGLEAEPGALSTVFQTCGRSDCHAEEASRVATSIMTTTTGLIAVNRWAAGELPAPDGHQTMLSLLAKKDVSRAEDYTRKLCGGCHLGARRDNRDDAIHSGGSGCGACHVEGGTRTGAGHQPIDGVVPDVRCLGCHSRSGRISLSYQGLAEISEELPPELTCESPTVLFDGRKGCQLPRDVHARAGLGCVDCHLHTEIMGDGLTHQHKEQQLELSCEDCHAPSASSHTWADVRDATTQRIVALRGQERAENEGVRLAKRGTPLWNLRPDGGELHLQQKGGERSWVIPPTPADAEHQLQGHERLACSSCHAQWVPICSDCHVEYKPEQRQWDFAKAAESMGAWKESAKHQAWGAPALAVVGESRIVPAAPGMIMTIEGDAEHASLRQRLYAALEPHTTNRQGRACAECHNNAFVLGLGTGTLAHQNDEFTFLPQLPDEDGQAPDRWTSLDASSAAAGTRSNVSSFNRDELQRILVVGLCLDCHSAANDSIYNNFAASKLRSGQAACTGPSLRAHAP